MQSLPTLLILIISLIGYYVNGALVGPIIIKEDGQNMTRYVVSGNTNGIKVFDTTIMLQHNTNIQIAKDPLNAYNSTMFMDFKLRNKTLSFITNLNNISCSCNAAFYLVTMPGYYPNGTINPGGGTYECGANDGGDLCWEMDIMEANKYAMQVTPHTCSQPPGTYATSCDGRGCYVNSYQVDSKGMCPSTDCKINTMKPFKESIHFGKTIHVTLTQDDNKYEFNACNNSQYIEQFNQALDYGMVLIMSYWGNTYQRMQWLDGMTGCNQDCDINGTAIFSDIEIY